MAKKSRKVKEEEEAGESKDGNATREGAGTDDAGSDMDSAVAESPRGGGKEKGGRKRKDSVQEEGAGGEKRKSTRGEAKKEVTSHHRGHCFFSFWCPPDALAQPPNMPQKAHARVTHKNIFLPRATRRSNFVPPESDAPPRTTPPRKPAVASAPA